MYEHVKTGCKYIPPSEQPRQFQTGYFSKKPRIGVFGCFKRSMANYSEWKTEKRHECTNIEKVIRLEL